MLSGRNFLQDQLNLADAGRQPGSSFKPFTLVAAFREGIPPGSVFSTKSPLFLARVERERLLVRVERRGRRRRRVREPVGRHAGLDQRRVRAADPGGRAGARGRRPPTTWGSTSELPAVPSLTLGTADVTPIEMASAYQTLANDGKHCEPFAVAKVGRRRTACCTGTSRRASKSSRPRSRTSSPRCSRAWSPAERARRRAARRLAGGGQDRHDAGLHERVVRRVHAAGLDGGLGGVPRNAGSALELLRRVGVRRHARRADLARLHVARDGGDAGRELPGAAGAGSTVRCPTWSGSRSVSAQNELAEANFTPTVETVVGRSRRRP